MSAPDTIWAVYGRVYERKPETEGLGDEYIRKDVADAEKAEAVARERSEAILEFCRKAGISDLQQVQALPHDVKMFRLAAAIRARGQE
jgi:hypothetical protein